MSEERASLAQDHSAGLAAYNTSLAMDRTTLAWLRTTMGMASFGFGMVAFFRAIQEKSPSVETARLHQGAIHMGTALILLGIAALVVAGLSHWLTLQKLRRGESTVLGPWPLSLTVVIFSTIIGLVGLWELYAR